MSNGGKGEFYIRRDSCTMIPSKRMAAALWEELRDFEQRNYFI